MVEQNVTEQLPTIEEVTQLLRQASEQGKKEPWFPDYDTFNLIPFSKILEIGLANYGENWKSYLTTQTRDFSRQTQPIVDRNIAFGCLTVATLDGMIGTLTHVLDSAEPLKVVQYLRALHDNKKGVPVIISGGRNGISEELLETLLRGLSDEGFVIKATEVMGTGYGRLTSLAGVRKEVIVERTDRTTELKELLPLSFE